MDILSVVSETSARQLPKPTFEVKVELGGRDSSTKLKTSWFSPDTKYRYAHKFKIDTL